MTALEFEAEYAKSGGVTVEELRGWGRVVIPCSCGEGGCQGWASYPADIVEDWKKMGRVDADWRWPPAD